MDNPYQTNNPITPPSSTTGGVFQQNSTSHAIEASSTAQAVLFASKGWVRFISVLGFIYFAIMVLIVFTTMTALSGFGRTGGGGFFFLVFLLLIAMTVVIFMLALRLSKFSSSISRMEISRNPADLESAMIEQMKFWRIAGILTLVGLVITVLSILVPTAFI